MIMPQRSGISTMKRIKARTMWFWKIIIKKSIVLEVTSLSFYTFKISLDPNSWRSKCPEDNILVKITSPKPNKTIKN